MLVNVDIRIRAADGRILARLHTAPPPMDRPSRMIREASTRFCLTSRSYAAVMDRVMLDSDGVPVERPYPGYSTSRR